METVGVPVLWCHLGRWFRMHCVCLMHSTALHQSFHPTIHKQYVLLVNQLYMLNRCCVTF